MIYAHWSQKYKEWTVRFEGRFYKLNQKIGLFQFQKYIIIYKIN